MAESRRAWAFLNSDLGRLLLGFVLTAIVGGFLTQSFQERGWRKQQDFEEKRQTAQWERDKQFEMLRRKLDNGEQALEEISDIMSTRLLLMRRIFAALSQDHLQEADADWPSYREVTDKWNVKLGIYQNKLRRLVSDSVARRFNNYETDNVAIKNPQSIHGQFFVAGITLERVRRCRHRSGCEPAAAEITSLSNDLNKLDLDTDAFIDGASALFLERASKLEQGRVEP